MTTPIPDSSADLAGTAVAGLDLTLIDAIAAMGQALVVVEDSRARYVNAAFCAMTGYDAPAVLAMRSFFDLFVPEQRGMLIDRMYHRLAGEAVPDRYETALVRKDGRRVELDASVRLWRRDAEPPLVVLLAYDVTGRKRTEAALAVSEMRFRQLVDTAEDVIFTVAESGHFTFVNQAASRLMQYTIEELVGRHFLELVRPDYREQAHAFYLSQIEDRIAATSFEFPAVARDGREVWFNQKVQLITDGDRIVTIQAIARDITERRRLEAYLRQAQKMDAVGRLAGGVAHDFNNLMTVVLGCVDMARLSLPENAPARDDLQQIQDAAERASALTQQLLGFGRKQMLRARPLRLAPVVTNMRGMLARLIGEDIRFAIRDETADADIVRADPAQIEQVVMNLAVNARDAMPAGGRLELAIGPAHLDEAYALGHPGAKAGDYVAITVTDTGTGMNEEVRAHAFEPFFTTKEPGTGTGLGLSTVYGIVKQNDGYVWIDSERGCGTVVSVYLPRRPGESVTVEPAPDASPEGLNGTETVLVVEDEGRVARLAARILGRFNYTVLSAASGEDALRILSKGAAIDLVVSDLVMSGMDGVELCRRLAALRPELPVLLVSGYNDRAADIEQSGYPFLGKPYTPLALARKVRGLLDS